MVAVVVLFSIVPVWAQQDREQLGRGSVIVDVEGHSCMGDDKSRKETRLEAIAETKRKAAEMALTHIRSETKIKDFTLSEDLINAYTAATVKILEELEQGWFKTDYAGECYRVKLKVEVVPDPNVMEEAVSKKDIIDDPQAPLMVKLWTDKKAYRQGDKIRIYLKGNKPFYGKIVYRDASDHLIQLMPNPYRRDNYFNGGVIYEIPSGRDDFELEVSPPFGTETISLYTSTAPLGDLDVTPAGGVYVVKTSSQAVNARTRGVKIVSATGSSPAAARTAEFSEAQAEIRTAQ